MIVADLDKGSVKNKLVEFAHEFAVDLIDLIEQNRVVKLLKEKLGYTSVRIPVICSFADYFFESCR